VSNFALNEAYIAVHLGSLLGLAHIVEIAHADRGAKLALCRVLTAYSDPSVTERVTVDEETNER
jgi:hypothetical protein